MANWPRTPIKELGEVFDGPHATPQTVDKGPLFLGISSLDKGRIRLSETRHVTEDDFIKWTRRVEPKANDFVFSYETKIGEAALIPEGMRCCLGRRMGLVRLNTSRVDPRFFLYVYLSPDFQEFLRSKTINGATVDRLPLKEFGDFPFPCPNLGVQGAIATMLGALDDKIELNRRMNETLEATARAIFKDWFVDFGPTRAKMEGREPYLVADIWALFPDSLDDDGKPAGWHTDKVAHFYEVSIGRTPPRLERHHFVAGGMGQTWLSIRDMGALQVFALESSEDITCEATNIFRIPIVRKGTVLLSFKLTIGRVAIAASDMCTNEAIANLAPKSGRYFGPYFTYCFLALYNYSKIGSTSSIATAFNSNSVREMMVNYHNLDVVQAFESLVRPIFNRIEANALESRTLAATRDLLLPKLMSGEARIKDAATLVTEAR